MNTEESGERAERDTSPPEALAVKILRDEAAKAHEGQRVLAEMTEDAANHIKADVASLKRGQAEQSSQIAALNAAVTGTKAAIGKVLEDTIDLDGWTKGAGPKIARTLELVEATREDVDELKVAFKENTTAMQENSKVLRELLAEMRQTKGGPLDSTNRTA